MTISQTTPRKSSHRKFAAVAVALLGLSLAGCSPDTPAPVADSAAATTPSQESTTAPIDVATSSATTSQEASTASGRMATLHVTGSRSEALIKTVVVTSDGKERNGEMTTKTLPFNEEITLPAESAFTKVLVLGKYANGATADISCTITIDGTEVASQTSSSHKPAECLFVEENH